MGLGRYLRERKKKRILNQTLLEVARWDGRATGVNHTRSNPLIVSLTSYPPRYNTLYATLHTLMTQTVKPDALILWVTQDDFAELPASIRALAGPDLEIAICPDYKSYKKIVPTLAEHPAADIVTADDDVLYHRTWLEELAEEAGDAVLCHRAHLIQLDEQGLPKPYQKWEHNLKRSKSNPLVFPTGCGGVIYPSGSLPAMTTDASAFLSLAPSADDVWLYWMHRINGGIPHLINGNFRLIEWADSQKVSLKKDNLYGTGNDDAVRAMISKFGFPT